MAFSSRLTRARESFRDTLSVTVTSDRSGLVMEDGGKVKLRGVPVGHVRAVHPGATAVTLQLDIDADQLPNIPANVGAQIRATSVFLALRAFLPTKRTVTRTPLTSTVLDWPGEYQSIDRTCSSSSRTCWRLPVTSGCFVSS